MNHFGFQFLSSLFWAFLILSGCRQGGDGLLSGLARDTTVSKAAISGNFPGCIRGKALDAGRIEVEFEFPENAKQLSVERDGIKVFSANRDAALATAAKFTDRNLSEGATYTYTCTAQIGKDSITGYNSLSVKTISTSPPAFSGILSAKYNHSDGGVSLKWATAGSSGVMAANYRIYANAGTQVNWGAAPVLIINEGTTLAADIAATEFKDSLGSGLGDELNYVFGVRACSPAGICDENTKTASFKVPDLGAPKTTGHSAIRMADGILFVTAPWTSSRGAISKRSIFVAPQSSGVFQEWKFVTIDNGQDVPTELTVENLSESTDYFLYVVDTDPSGQSNAAQVAVPSRFASISGIKKPPSVPSLLVANAVDAHSIQLSWADNSSNETGFKLERSLDNVKFTEIATPTSNSYRDSNLVSESNYFYRVRAYNSSGNSVFSPVTMGTPPAVPGKPGALVATPANQKVTLSWTQSTGSGAITYQVERGLIATGPFSVMTEASQLSALTFVDSSVDNGTPYYYRIVAKNAGGASEPSEVANAIPNTTPMKPSNLVLATVSSSRVLISWADNSFNEQGFKIERSLNSATGFSVVKTAAAGATSIEDTGLASNQTFYYRVASFNSMGISDYTPVKSVIPPSVPDEPKNFVATSGSAIISLAWSAPISNGTLKYGLKRREGTQGSFVTLSYAQNLTALDYQDSNNGAGLTNGTLYQYMVFATNEGGTGVDSDIASATPVAGIPSMPSDVVVSAISSNSLNVTWKDNSFFETEFRVQRSGNGVDWTDINGGASNSVTTVVSTTSGAIGSSYEQLVSGLTTNASYYFRIAAYNSAGQSAFTSAISELPPSVPGVPGFTRFEPGSPNRSRLPTIIGTADTATKTVKIYRGSCGGFEVGSGTKASYISAGIQLSELPPESINATTTFYVRAFNSLGQSSANCTTASYIHDEVAPVVGFNWPAPNAEIGSGAIRIEGKCETGTQVKIIYPEGMLDVAAQNHQVPCVDASFTDTITFDANAMGNYAITLQQIDSSGNSSSSVSQTIKRIFPKPTAVVTGQNFTCAIISKGVKCWGLNAAGQLGVGDNSPRLDGDHAYTIEIPYRSSDLGVIQLAAGNTHACALFENGKVKCWGDNAQKQLAIAASVGNSTTPVEITGLTNVVQIAAGSLHSCARNNSGDVFCWGYNKYSQIGDGGSATPVSAPWQVTSNWKAKSLAAATHRSCAITQDIPAKVKCWGINTNGEGGTGALTATPAPTNVNDANLSLASATQLILGDYFSCAVLGGGSEGVACWGNNYSGAFGGANLGTSRYLTPTLSISASQSGTTYWAGNSSPSVCGAYSDSGSGLKTLKCHGDNTSGILGDGTFTKQTSPVTASTALSSGGEPISVSISANFACAVLQGAEKNEIKCWGNNAQGQLGEGTKLMSSDFQSTAPEVAGLSSVTEITGGNNSSCSISASGSVHCWGSNGYGQLGISQSFSSLQMPEAEAPIISSGATKVAIANYSACALSSSGGIECWGYGAYGQLTIGTANLYASTDSLIRSDATDIAAGTYHYCAVVNGAAKCWGYNNNGQLGDGTVTNRTVPVVPIAAQVSVISAGAYHSCAVVDHQVKCWGWVSRGQVGNGVSATNSSVPPTSVLTASDGATLNAVTKLALGNQHSCAVQGKKIYCWGYNGFRQTGFTAATDQTAPFLTFTSTGNDEIMDLASHAGADHTCAVVNHRALCWGKNDHGQLGRDTGSVSYSAVPTTPTFLEGVNVNRVAVGTDHSCAVLETGVVRCWGSNEAYQMGTNPYMRFISVAGIHK